MSETRWLDPHEQEIWRLYLEVSLRLYARLGRELVDETQVSLSEYDVWVKLSEAPNRTLRMSELASRTTQSRSRLTHAVARMEKSGHIVRTPCEDDGRGVQATLTDAGAALLRSAAPSHVRSVREHFIDFISPDDIPVLTELLSRMATHLRDVDPNKAPFNVSPLPATVGNS